MFEGHDTVSSGLGFALYRIGNDVTFQQKLHEDLDEVFGEDLCQCQLDFQAPATDP